MATDKLIFAPHVLIALIIYIRYAAADDALGTLQYAIEHGLGSIPNEQDRRIIEFWMNAGRIQDDIDMNKCCAHNLDVLRHRIESDEQATQMTDVRRLYNFAEFDLLTSCGLRVGEIARQLPILREGARRLLVTVREFDLWFSRGTYGSIQSVAESMMYLLRIDRYVNRTDFIDAWSRGPCSGVMERVTMRRNLALLDYAKMITETRVYPIELGDEVSIGTIAAVSIVRYCYYFRSMDTLTEVWKALQAGHSDERLSYQRIRDRLGFLRNQTALRL